MKITAARIHLVKSGRFHPVLLELLTPHGVGTRISRTGV